MRLYSLGIITFPLLMLFLVALASEAWANLELPVTKTVPSAAAVAPTPLIRVKFALFYCAFDAYF